MKNDQIQAAQREETSSSVLEPHSSNSRGRAPEEVGQGVVAGDDGSILQKLRKMVSKPTGPMPSLALDNLVSEDGVLRRPYESSISNVRDPSPDRNDSDSISAYEDASAETPEQDKIFPSEGDTLELPDDSEDKEKSPTNNPLVSESKTEEPKNPDACVVS